MSRNSTIREVARPFGAMPVPAMMSGVRADRSNNDCFIHWPRSPKERPVVAHEDDDGVVGQLQPVERIEHTADVGVENRHGLIVDAMATTADGRAERDAAMLMMHTRQTCRGYRRWTVGATTVYDTHDFVDVTRELIVTPHVTQNTARRGGAVYAM